MEVSQVPMVLLAEPRMALLEPDENPEAERAVRNCPVRNTCVFFLRRCPSRRGSQQAWPQQKTRMEHIFRGIQEQTHWASVDLGWHRKDTPPEFSARDTPRPRTPPLGEVLFNLFVVVVQRASPP